MWPERRRALDRVRLYLARLQRMRSHPWIMKNICLAMLALGVPAAPAGSSPETRQWGDDDHSHDQARRAVERGEALPVAEVLRHLRAQMPGDVVAIEYEYEFERWVYEFKVIDPQGRLRKVHLDAASGELIKVADD